MLPSPVDSKQVCRWIIHAGRSFDPSEQRAPNLRKTHPSLWLSFHEVDSLFVSTLLHWLFPVAIANPVRSAPEDCPVWGVGWGNGSAAIQILEQPPHSVCEGSAEPRTLYSMVASDAVKPRLEWIIWPSWTSPSSASQTRLRGSSPCLPHRRK